MGSSKYGPYGFDKAEAFVPLQMQCGFNSDSVKDKSAIKYTGAQEFVDEDGHDDVTDLVAVNFCLATDSKSKTNEKPTTTPNTSDQEETKEDPKAASDEGKGGGE